MVTHCGKKEKSSLEERTFENLERFLKITEAKSVPIIIIMISTMIMITMKTMIITGAQSRSDLPRGTRSKALAQSTQHW